MRVRGGALFGGNTTWGDFLMVGGDGRQNYINNTTTASVATTDGNLHLDAASGHATYASLMPPHIHGVVGCLPSRPGCLAFAPIFRHGRV